MYQDDAERVKREAEDARLMAGVKAWLARVRQARDGCEWGRTALMAKTAGGHVTSVTVEGTEVELVK